MRTKNLTFQGNLVKMGVYIPIHSPDVPDIKLPVIPTLTKKIKFQYIITQLHQHIRTFVIWQ